MNIFELRPNDGHKSFYGKAKVVIDGSRATLVSYNTPVCRFDISDGSLSRLWGGYSVTTMRHINAFTARYGLNVGGKKWWEALPVVS